MGESIEKRGKFMGEFANSERGVLTVTVGLR